MAGLKEQFLVAFSFLTIFKVNAGEGAFSSGENSLARSAAFFPLVGALIGCLLAAVDVLFSRLFPLPVASVIVLAAGAFFTAGLHLDGFADTVDGLGAWLKDGKEKALEVMKDSRSGALGVLGIVFLVLLKYGLLVAISGHLRSLSLFLMPVTGRWLLVAAGKIYPYARRTPGLGENFAGRVSAREVAVATFFLLVLTAAGVFAAGSIAYRPLYQFAAAGFGAAAAGGLGISFFLARCFGGMTGDTLGAVSELGEVFFLLGVAAVAGASPGVFA